MTDKKYTDEEIIKASECCRKDDYPNQCQECPMDNQECGFIMHNAVHEVMITQKAKIERLEADNERLEAENKALHRLLDAKGE